MNFDWPDGDNVERSCAFDPHAILAPVAIHQAVHAAATVLLGRQPRELAIPAGGLAGPCDYLVVKTSDTTRSIRDLVEITAMIVIAGAEGEVLLTELPAPSAASKADAGVAMTIISAMTGSSEETEVYASLLRARAHHLIATPRAKSAIITIADLLINTGTVSARAAARIVAEALNCDEINLKQTLRDRTSQPEAQYIEEMIGLTRRERRLTEAGGYLRRQRDRG